MTVTVLHPVPQPRTETSTSPRCCAECGLPTHVPDLAPTIACDTYGDGELCPTDFWAHVDGCLDCRLDEYAYEDRMDGGDW